MSSGFEDGPYYFGLISDECCPFMQIPIGHYNLKKIRLDDFMDEVCPVNIFAFTKLKMEKNKVLFLLIVLE